MQSTDKKVNEVTPSLFECAADAAAMASLPVRVASAVLMCTCTHWFQLRAARGAVARFTAHKHADANSSDGDTRSARKQVSQIEDLVRPVGLAPTKAKNLSRMSRVSARILGMDE